MKRIAVVLAMLAVASSCTPPPAPRHTLTCLFATPKEKLRREDVPWVVITVARDGRLVWNGSPIDQKLIDEYLRDAGEQDPRPFVIIGTRDAEMSYSNVAPVLRLAHEKNAYRLGLETSYTATRPPHPGRTPRPVSAECWMGPWELPGPKTQDEIEIGAENVLRWNGQIISYDDLVKHLEEAGRATPQPLISLKIAPEARFRTVADLIYHIDAIGPQHLRFEAD